MPDIEKRQRSPSASCIRVSGIGVSYVRTGGASRVDGRNQGLCGYAGDGRDRWPRYQRGAIGPDQFPPVRARREQADLRQ